MKIALICTGTELLKGSCCNSDLAFAGSRLTGCGMPPVMEICVGDRPAELVAALGNALACADILLISGGLGPTRDDITLATVARFFGVELYEHPELKAKVETLWAQRHSGRCPGNQYKQAQLPVGGRYFANSAGVASGIGFDVDYKSKPRHIYLLPGPPGEFETVFADGILPELCRLRENFCFTDGFFVCGMGETVVANRVEPLLEGLPLEIAYTAQPGGTKIFLSGEKDVVNAALVSARAALGGAALPQGVFAVPEYLLELLGKQGETFGCAESCTGGLVADSIVNLPGASAVFKGGIVAYANDIKERVLAVDPEILQNHGAVSPECAAAMAEGACRTLNCSCAVSTTGIAGPDGGSAEKPVGLVYVAAVYRGITSVKELRLRGSRRMIRERAAAQALQLLCGLMGGNGENVC